MNSLRKLRWPVEFFFTVYMPKLWDYAKVLWNDYDFQFDDILAIIELKTRRTRECLLEENAVKVDVRHMLEVEALCRRLKADDYLGDECRELRTKYKMDDLDVRDWFIDTPQRRVYHKEAGKLLDRSEVIKAREKARLFHLLHRYLNCWWS